MSHIAKIEQLYIEYERSTMKVKEEQFTKKAIKDELVQMMKEAGIEELVASGVDGELMQLAITYPMRETLNKKDLAKSVGLKTKDLNKQQDFVKYVEEGRITSELIEKFTIREEREQFSAQELDDAESSDE